MRTSCSMIAVEWMRVSMSSTPPGCRETGQRLFQQFFAAHGHPTMAAQRAVCGRDRLDRRKRVLGRDQERFLAFDGAAEIVELGAERGHLVVAVAESHPGTAVRRAILGTNPVERNSAVGAADANIGFGLFIDAPREV